MEQTRGQEKSMRKPRVVRVRFIALLGGPMFFALTLLSTAPAGLSDEAWRVAGIAVWMAVWWMTEAVPIPVTSLLPLVLLPLFRISGISEAARPYAHPLIYLFLGGFFLAEAIQRSGLHKRLALRILSSVRDSPQAVVLGFMLVAAFLSMWVSNTATTLMMIPIALSVVDATAAQGTVDDRSIARFGTLLMLSLAYAASVGGIGTLIGTPPNALMAGFLEETYDISVSFSEWMIIGVPMVVVGLPLVYFILARVMFKPDFKKIPGGRELFRSEYRALGRMSSRERRVSRIFIGVAILWIARPLLVLVLPGITDTGIAIAGAVLLFAIPSGGFSSSRLLSWEEARSIPWGILILFGGGLSLADAISGTGLSEWIGQGLGSASDVPPIVMIFLFAITITLVTELTSNTATAAAFLPVVGSVSVSMSVNPLLFVVPATIAASCAFVLPVATPPNAIVYGSGYIRLSDMAKAGLVLDLIFAIIITLYALILPAMQTG